jgi:hypothetical protein
MGEEAISGFLANLNATLEALSAEEVWEKGIALRVRLEQYLKQFLALYGPLALDWREQEQCVSQTLGRLSLLTIRILGAPNPAGDACGGDARWEEMAEQIRLAKAEPGWFDQVKSALDAIPRWSNNFAHHIVRNGRELSDVERRNILRDFIADARTVADCLRRRCLYPVCLRYAGVKPDDRHVIRFEFDSDPARREPEAIVFTALPPVIPMEAVYRQALMMFPLAGQLSSRPLVDPLLRPLFPA